jgi:hypothetical protein
MISVNDITGIVIRMDDEVKKIIDWLSWVATAVLSIGADKFQVYVNIGVGILALIWYAIRLYAYFKQSKNINDDLDA